MCYTGFIPTDKPVFNLAVDEALLKRLDGFCFKNSETFEKCSILFKFKEGEDFNRRNTLSILRIALRFTSCEI